MKATELMVGDWVLCPDNMQRQVRYLQVRPSVIGIGGSSYDEDEIQPIPLTPEILEQNGLKIDKYKGGFFPACFKEDEHYDVEIEMKDEEIAWSINCGEYWIKRLNYVHELQHALRLFGIKKDIEL